MNYLLFVKCNVKITSQLNKLLMFINLTITRTLFHRTKPILPSRFDLTWDSFYISTG